MQNKRTQRDGNCALCERDMRLTFHHLIPKKVHRRPRFKKRFSNEELNNGVLVCRLCHNAIHRFFDEMTLAKEFYTVELLLADEKIQKHIAWARRIKV